jgi:hypothetical protein
MSMRGMFATALVLGAIAAWPLSAARAESQQDREACTPDVYAHCGDLIPDREAIVACLKKKINQLSPACRTVMRKPFRPTASAN